MKRPRVTNASQSAHLGWRVTNAAPSHAEIYIFDVIGDPWSGTTAGDFVRELNELDVETITLNINSPGGFVDDALAMYDAIQRHPAEVTAHIVVAASAASFVAMAADQRRITKNGKVFIHDAQGFGIGNGADFRRLADMLDEESENIASIYAEHAGGTAAEWRERMLAGDGIGSTYRGQEAVDIGLADEIAEVPARQAAALRVAAQVPATTADAPDLAALLAGTSVAERVAYKPPIPALEGLLSKNPVKFAGATR